MNEVSNSGWWRLKLIMHTQYTLDNEIQNVELIKSKLIRNHQT